MTANELAVDLELQSSQMEYGYAVSDWKLLSDSATMLRKQQAEIESLKLRELTDKEIIEVCSQIEPFDDITIEQAFIEFARAILTKASEK